MIRITDTLSIAESDIAETFVRASGPGGQNVNKVATAVQLRFDTNAGSLPQDVGDRLRQLAGSRLTRDGVIVIFADRYRTQQRNREDALARLVALIRRAVETPKPRRPTRPTAASKERRLQTKSGRATVKRLRQPPYEG